MTNKLLLFHTCTSRTQGSVIQPHLSKSDPDHDICFFKKMLDGPIFGESSETVFSQSYGAQISVFSGYSQ